MTRKTNLIVATIAALGLAPLMASAEQTTTPEVDVFQSAKITIEAAGATALKEHAGTLAGVQLNNENGAGVYEAEVVDAAGMHWIVKVDAVSGAVLAQGQADLMDDEGENGSDEGGDESGDADNG